MPELKLINRSPENGKDCNIAIFSIDTSDIFKALGKSELYNEFEAKDCFIKILKSTIQEKNKDVALSVSFENHGISKLIIELNKPLRGKAFDLSKMQKNILPESFENTKATLFEEYKIKQPKAVDNFTTLPIIAEPDSTKKEYSKKIQDFYFQNNSFTLTYRSTTSTFDSDLAILKQILENFKEKNSVSNAKITDDKIRVSIRPQNREDVLPTAKALLYQMVNKKLITEEDFPSKIIPNGKDRIEQKKPPTTVRAQEIKNINTIHKYKYGDGEFEFFYYPKNTENLQDQLKKLTDITKDFSAEHDLQILQSIDSQGLNRFKFKVTVKNTESGRPQARVTSQLFGILKDNELISEKDVPERLTAAFKPKITSNNIQPTNDIGKN